MKRIYLLLLMTGICFFSEAQESNKKEGYTQTIRGKVLDQVSKTGIPGASIILWNSDPLQGTTEHLHYGEFWYGKRTTMSFN